VENLITILDKNLIIGLIVLVVIVPVYYKMGLLNWLTGKSGESIRDDFRHARDGDFQIDISRELGAIHEKMKALPEIRTEVKRLADHVAVQNGRIGKLENR
jgi:hypothetical protein